MHTLRHTTSRDTDRIMEIVEGARAFLKSQGLDQWQKGYPDRAIFASDAQTGLGYVLEEDGQIQAVCAVTFTEDPKLRSHIRRPLAHRRCGRGRGSARLRRHPPHGRGSRAAGTGHSRKTVCLRLLPCKKGRDGAASASTPTRATCPCSGPL